MDRSVFTLITFKSGGDHCPWSVTLTWWTVVRRLLLRLHFLLRCNMICNRMYELGPSHSADVMLPCERRKSVPLRWIHLTFYKSFPRKSFPLMWFVYLSDGGRNERADYQSSLLLLCVLDGGAVSGNRAPGPLMRETGVHHLWAEWEKGAKRSLGCSGSDGGKRNVLFPQSQRESDDAAPGREGGRWIGCVT